MTAASNRFSPALSRFLVVFNGILEILYFWIIGVFKAILPSNLLPQKSFTNDVVVITGAGGGLGRQLALRFAQRGARLILWDLNEDANNETKKLVEREGAPAHIFKVDISNREAIYENAKKSIEIYGRVDVCLCNAGIVNNKKFWECPDDFMEKVMAVNCTSLFYLSKAFIPGMIERDHGHFITIASMAGKVGIKGMLDYCTSKFGAVGFTEALFAELKNRSKNLYVTLACPYYINTGMFDGVEAASPVFLPILDVKYCADRIIEAIATNANVIYLPRFCYVTMFLKELLPTRASLRMAALVGVDKELDGFYVKRSPAKA